MLPLLSELIEDARSDLPTENPDFVYPDPHRVRLAVDTWGPCRHEQFAGTRAGTGHDIPIEAVNEPMGDQRFRKGSERMPNLSIMPRGGCPGVRGT